MLHLKIHKQEIFVSNKKLERLFTRYNCKTCGKLNIFSPEYHKLCATCGEPQPEIDFLVASKISKFKVIEIILNYYHNGKLLCSN